ncbi:MAG TPA: hypothetical protein VG367_06395 [Mucilaginibacter sp.]|jgi:hypothetical protein|nr:hypothetical protein [Mucilaginibacter sp.]
MINLKSLIVFIAVVSAIAFSSCKKDKKTVAASGSLTATIDGKAASFSTHTTVLTGTENNSNFTTIQGNASNGSTMSITIYGALTQGATFTSNDPDPGNEPVLLYISGSDDYTNETSNPSVTVMITAVSSSSIQGTFSGTLTDIATGANQGKTTVIASGKFNVPR